MPTFYAGVFGEVEMTPAEQEAAQAELREKKSQTDEPGPTDVPPVPANVPWVYGGPSKSKKKKKSAKAFIPLDATTSLQTQKEPSLVVKPHPRYSPEAKLRMQKGFTVPIWRIPWPANYVEPIRHDELPTDVTTPTFGCLPSR